MYTFTFIFSDGNLKEYQHISKVKYYQFSETEVSKDEIFTHNFPLGVNMQLFSDNKTYKISGSGLRSIEVVKEAT